MTKDGRLCYRTEIRRLINEQGPKGLFRGFWATFWREVPCLCVYFYVYRGLRVKGETILLENKTWSQSERAWFSRLWAINAGGLAGLSAWVISFPFDIIKTK